MNYTFNLPSTDYNLNISVGIIAIDKLIYSHNQNKSLDLNKTIYSKLKNNLYSIIKSNKYTTKQKQNSKFTTIYLRKLCKKCNNKIQCLNKKNELIN